MKKNKLVTIITVLLVVFGGLIAWYQLTPGKYDTLVQCLTDRGVTFYGAFWCPHCQEQKRMFSKSVEFLPYVECSTPDGRGQLQICIDAGIEGYPTWEFADGERANGVLTPEELARRADCPLE